MSAFARSRNPVASPTQPNGADKGRTWDPEIPAAARGRSLRPGLPPHPVSPAPPGRHGFSSCTRRRRAGKWALALPPSARLPRPGRRGPGVEVARQVRPKRSLSPRSLRLSLQMWQKPGASSTVTLDPQRSATPRTRRSCWRAC